MRIGGQRHYDGYADRVFQIKIDLFQKRRTEEGRKDGWMDVAVRRRGS